jgi:serine/threonine protein kinase
VASTPDKVSVHDALTPGTRLDEFEIVRVLGTGGFGIVYLARDHVLLRDVAIKEYMPAALAGRGDQVAVSLRSQAFVDTFAKGLESFLSEARLLASFDHRSLVKVHRFWRSNATAYMAMQYYAGQTLKDARLHMTAPPDEAWIDAFLQALLGVLELLHAQGVYHRDISPDNILLLDDGRPVLLDFGSARQVMADSPQSFTAHLKPQFAPLEQYADESGGMRQGPWTDLYALGATMYFVLMGRAPTPSVVRAVRDVLPTLASQAGTTIPRVRASLLATIDWTLALAPEQRPQSVLSVRRALSGDVAPPPPSPRQLGAPAAATPDPAPAPQAAARPDRPRHAAPSRPWFSRLAATFWGPAADRDPTPPTSRRRAHLSVAASLALTGMVALGWGAWTLDRPSVPPSGTAAWLPEAVTTTTVIAPPAGAPMPTTAATPPSAMTRVTMLTRAAPSASSPGELPVRSPSADPVALWEKPEAQPASGAGSGLAAEGVSTVPPRSIAAPPAARVAPRDRHRTARPKAQASSTVAKSSTPAKNACDGSGMLARAWCALTPCKAPRGRSNPECIERLRAEAARQQRVERQ